MTTTPAAPTVTTQTADEPVWANPFVSVRMQPVTRYDGFQYDTTVVRSGSGKGAVVIPVCTFRGRGFVGVIDIDRPAIGNRRGIEFPRGGTVDLGAKEALRELREETGLVGVTPDLIGIVHPDTGILDTEVAIYRAPVAPVLTPTGDWARQAEGWLDPETGSVFRWMSEPEFLGAIMAGKVTCGLTLSSWSMHKANSARRALPHAA